MSIQQVVRSMSLGAALALVFVSASWAQPGNRESMVTSGLNDQGEVRLLVNKSTVITTSRAQKRLSVGEPSIVDVNGISPTRFLLTAKKPGSTQVIVWDEQDQAQTIEVIVQPDISGLRDQLGRIPGVTIDATTADDTVVLRGRVPNLAAAEQAQALAAAYGKNVANLLEVAGGQQVMLQVRIAEVSKSAVRQLGVNLGYSDGSSFAGSTIGNTSNFRIRPLSVDADASDLGLRLDPTANIFGRIVAGDTAVLFFIDALRSNNLLRVLAEPNLVAMSGQEATFLAGGEFPIPVPQSGSGGESTITIEYREFGVKLSFIPIVLGDGNIRLKVSPEVSDLDFTTAVRFGGFVVPGLSQRKLTTTVELGDGQTFALAGLLNQSVSAERSNTPVLGDLPILGTLFRSVRYQRKETELVVFVTPRVVAPMSPDQVPAMPGEKWREPNDGELFLKGDLGGSIPGKRDAAPRLYIGTVGFTPVTDPTAPAAGAQTASAQTTGATRAKAPPAGAPKK